MNKESKTIFRITYEDFQILRQLRDEAGDKETQAFVLCSKAKGQSEVVFLASRIVTPGAKDLEEQSGASVIPTAQFQALAYGLAYDLGLSVFDVHTHPFADKAQLSAIDFHHGEKNGRCIAEEFPEGTVMGMVVFDSSMHSFDGQVWNNEAGKFQKINNLEILGSPIQILPGIDADVPEDEAFARHQIIPNWDQNTLGQLKVLLAGLGGNGSLVFSALLNLGIGSKGGWVKACDHDTIEVSNLPRVPYAIPQDVGRLKAEIAQLYAIRNAPKTSVSCYSKKLQDEEMMAIAKEAHIIIGAVDSEGCRKTLNSISARYLIPYIDVATEIIPEDSVCQSIGQVHTFIPGVTGCLTCAGLIDPSEAALDLLSEQQASERARVGYVRGTNETPTPSVLHLNGVTSYLAISQLLRLVFGEGAERSAFLNYDRQNCQLMPAEALTDPNCPVCGKDGYLGEGDEAMTDFSPCGKHIFIQHCDPDRCFVKRLRKPVRPARV